MTKRQEKAVHQMADEIKDHILELQDIYWDGSEIDEQELIEAVALSLIKRHGKETV